MNIFSLFLFLLWIATSSEFHIRGSESFTVAVLPDTQYYTAYFKPILEEQVQWVCSCKQPLNIATVVHMGDVVEHSDNHEEWQTAQFCTTCLYRSKIPFSIAAGNHDKQSDNVDLPYENFNHYFRHRTENVTTFNQTIENHYRTI